MSRSLVPVKIRPHLVKYLFERFPTEKERESHYCGKKVKSVRINTNSPLGKYIRSMCVKSDYPQNPAHFNFFFSVDDNCSTGSLYGYKSGKYSFLKFPEEFIEDLNEMLEEMFYISFYYFVEGYRQTKEFGGRSEAIRVFIDRYDLYECGFNFSTLDKRFTRLSVENRNFAPLVQKPR